MYDKIHYKKKKKNLGVESEGGLPAEAERVGDGLFLRILLQC